MKDKISLMAASEVLHVDAEWDRLTAVAVVRPENYVKTEPINATLRRFAGTKGEPSASLLVDQHVNVVRALDAAGVQVREIKPTPELPYQFNVRDAAMVIGSRLVLGRMVRKEREDEPDVCKSEFCTQDVVNVPAGYLEGGDIAVTPDEVFVGLGERTDERGYASLRDLLSGTRKVTPIRLARDVLHLDVAMNLLGPNIGVLHRPSIAGDLPESLRQVEWIEVTDDEFAEQAANILVLEPRKIMVDARHERLHNALTTRGFQCITVRLDEITKVGGGVRCMTLPLVRTSTPETFSPGVESLSKPRHGEYWHVRRGAADADHRSADASNGHDPSRMQPLWDTPGF